MSDWLCLFFGHEFFRYLPGAHGPRVRIFTDARTNRQYARCWRCGVAEPLTGILEQEAL